MPQTKNRKKKTTTTISAKDAEVKMKIKQYFQRQIREFEKEMQVEYDSLVQRYKCIANKEKLKLPAHIGQKTVQEVRDSQNWLSSTASVFSNISIASKTMSRSNSVTRSKRPKRSCSSNDEGYTTAESSAAGSGRQSRLATRLRATRASRSLSRTQMQKRNIKTPINRQPPAAYGTVTPKMKPNTPQVILRRPQQGEVVLSLQGSPLLTGNVAVDAKANVNIPLPDGRMVSIQPQRGLRVSQIPALDPEVRSQLETLRDNLNKMCALGGKL